MRSERRRIWRSHWLPVALYVALIFSLSSIRRPPPTPGLLAEDKLLHLIEYGGLGLLLARAVWAHGLRRDLTILFTVAGGSLVASLDELYQLTVPGRVGDLVDVVADVVGVVLAMLGYALLARRERS